MPALDNTNLLAYARAHAAPDTPKSGGFSLGTAFHDLLDIVNPLQHLPVVGTLYRAISGDTIGTVEKIAGDTLYGGLWGAVSSVADTAFEAVTGKDFGATVLAFAEDTLGFGHHDAKVQVASAAPAPAVATPAAASDGADVMALTGALSAKGITGDLSTRALYAYRRSQGLTASPLTVN